MPMLRGERAIDVHPHGVLCARRSAPAYAFDHRNSPADLRVRYSLTLSSGSVSGRVKQDRLIGGFTFWNDGASAYPTRQQARGPGDRDLTSCAAASMSRSSELQRSILLLCWSS